MQHSNKHLNHGLTFVKTGIYHDVVSQSRIIDFTIRHTYMLTMPCIVYDEYVNEYQPSDGIVKYMYWSWMRQISELSNADILASFIID